MPSTKQLIEDPSYLAYKLDFNTESIEFLLLAKDDLNKATWLSRDLLNANSTSISVPLIEVIKCLNSQSVADSKPPMFIFHTAYCASTFLSRCLTVKGLSVCLREPQILLDAANAKRLKWRARSSNLDFRHLPALALRLLQKHAELNETLIIKPINSVNNIIPELMHISASSKALLLYTDARNFLLSTLKKGEQAKQQQRAMFDLLRCDFPHLSQLGLSDAIHMSDLKLCLTLWRLQLEQAEQALLAPPLKGLLRSLHAEKIISDLDSVLHSANDFLQLGIANEMLSAEALGDTASQDAKDRTRRFSVEQRESNYKAIEQFYAEDLPNGYEWLTTNNPSTSLMPQLSNALKVDSE